MISPLQEYISKAVQGQIEKRVKQMQRNVNKVRKNVELQEEKDVPGEGIAVGVKAPEGLFPPVAKSPVAVQKMPTPSVQSQSMDTFNRLTQKQDFFSKSSERSNVFPIMQQKPVVLEKGKVWQDKAPGEQFITQAEDKKRSAISQYIGIEKRRMQTG